MKSNEFNLIQGKPCGSKWVPVISSESKWVRVFCSLVTKNAEGAPRFKSSSVSSRVPFGGRPAHCALEAELSFSKVGIPWLKFGAPQFPSKQLDRHRRLHDGAVWRDRSIYWLKLDRHRVHFWNDFVIVFHLSRTV